MPGRSATPNQRPLLRVLIVIGIITALIISVGRFAGNIVLDNRIGPRSDITIPIVPDAKRPVMELSEQDGQVRYLLAQDRTLRITDRDTVRTIELTNEQMDELYDLADEVIACTTCEQPGRNAARRELVIAGTTYDPSSPQGAAVVARLTQHATSTETDSTTDTHPP